MKKVIFYSFCFILFLSFYSIAYGIDNNLDSDGDGLIDNVERTVYHTNPDYYDTDGDGYNDKTEIDNGYTPLFANHRKMIDVDSDSDGLNDKWEITIGTDLLIADTDDDGFTDNIEVINGYNPLKEAGIKAPKIIKVNIAKQNLSYYFNGRLIESFPISGGISKLPTPFGTYTILDKDPSKNYSGYNYYYPNTKWNMHFTNRNGYRYYIHGAYWHDNFGFPMSHGCVNVAYSNMERLYNWTNVGTKVEIY